MDIIIDMGGGISFVSETQKSNVIGKLSEKKERNSDEIHKKNKNTTPREINDSVVDAVIRDLAETHIIPLISELKKRRLQTLGEDTNMNINGYYEDVCIY